VFAEYYFVELIFVALLLVQYRCICVLQKCVLWNRPTYYL